MDVPGQFPMIAVLGGGGVVVAGIVLYQILNQEEPGPDPFREKSPTQRQYMREVRLRNIETLRKLIRHDG